VRRLIEGRFDEIKAATEARGEGALPLELSEWCGPAAAAAAAARRCPHRSCAAGGAIGGLALSLAAAADARPPHPLRPATAIPPAPNRIQSICWVCREEVRGFPPYVRRRLAPLLPALHEALDATNSLRRQLSGRDHSDPPASAARWLRENRVALLSSREAAAAAAVAAIDGPQAAAGGGAGAGGGGGGGRASPGVPIAQRRAAAAQQQQQRHLMEEPPPSPMTPGSARQRAAGGYTASRPAPILISGGSSPARGGSGSLSAR